MTVGGRDEMNIKCNHCGFEAETTGSSCGVISGEDDESVDVYGHHSCPDGEMGTFVPSPILLAAKTAVEGK